MDSGGRRIRAVVVGLGRLGRACAEAILASEDLALAGIVRRFETELPDRLRGVPVAPHVSELGGLGRPAVALLCVPPGMVTDVGRGLLEQGLAIVECARIPAPSRRAHLAALDRAARHGHASAIVGAGWDPGALSLLEGLIELLVPKGHTRVRHHAAASLHHTLAARSVRGVRDALCTELEAPSGRTQRYVYVELDPGADAGAVSEALCTDPLFLDEETVVLPVESVAALEAGAHGVTLERDGLAGGVGHQRFLVEARFDVHGAAAQVMTAAARALVGSPPGARMLSEVPLAAMLSPRALESLAV